MPLYVFYIELIPIALVLYLYILNSLKFIALAYFTISRLKMNEITNWAVDTLNAKRAINIWIGPLLLSVVLESIGSNEKDIMLKDCGTGLEWKGSAASFQLTANA